MTADIIVLHVDDDPAFADVVATFLQREGDFAVVTAHDAATGIATVEATDIDCVVSDYEMPGRNGLEFLEAVRVRDDRLPFVLFTGKGSEEIAGEAVTAGVSDYLQKATGVDQYSVLANRIRNLVEKSRIERRINRAYTAIDNTEDGIALFGIDGQFVYVNDAYAAFYGREPDSLIGEDWEPLYPDSEIDRYNSTVKPALSGTGHWTGECTGKRSDGSRFTAHHSITRLGDGSHVCVIDHSTVR